mgnify:CR=1 FL=1
MCCGCCCGVRFRGRAATGCARRAVASVDAVAIDGGRSGPRSRRGRELFAPGLSRRWSRLKGGPLSLLTSAPVTHFQIRSSNSFLACRAASHFSVGRRPPDHLRATMRVQRCPAAWPGHGGLTATRHASEWQARLVGRGVEGECPGLAAIPGGPLAVPSRVRLYGWRDGVGRTPSVKQITRISRDPCPATPSSQSRGSRTL